jgi:hypothetical protein
MSFILTDLYICDTYASEVDSNPRASALPVVTSKSDRQEESNEKMVSQYRDTPTRARRVLLHGRRHDG